MAPDVEAAVSVLLSGLTEGDREAVKLTPEVGLIEFHHGWGTGIRNDFGLWAGNRPLIESCIELGGPACADPDSASQVIIKAVWNRLNHLPVQHHQRTVFDNYRCERCGGEARVPRWQEDEATPSADPRCDECSLKTSPEYLQQQEQLRRDNEVATIAFEKARRLGVLINERYLRAKGTRARLVRLVRSSDDHHLLDAARDLYANNPEFRSLWDEVKGERPGTSHLKWLRLWKRL